jgi:predicted ATPase with chaperone activity
LLDRIDIQIEVPAVPYRELRAEEVAESSADMLGRVERARETQHARGLVNSRMPARLIRKQCALDEAGERTLEMAMRRMSLSARAHDRILKVARTVADLGLRSGHREAYRRHTVPEPRIEITGTDGFRWYLDGRNVREIPSHVSCSISGGQGGKRLRSN